MNLVINKKEKLDKKVIFEGYYIDKNHGVVVSNEEIVDKEYILNNKTNLNGLYRLVVINENNIQIITDRYRSLPVFYTKNNDILIIGNDFFEVYKTALKNKMNLTYDEEAANNYIRFGYVPYDDTIIKEIKEMPSGSIMNVNINNLEVSMEKYWQLRYSEGKNFHVKVEKERIKEIYNNVFKDFCKFLNRNKKKINFALSGGLDSRLVLSGILKFIDDKSRITINTFGSIYSDDVIIPYEIAYENNIALKHYSISEFSNIINNSKLMIYATQGRSLAHYQDGFPLIEYDNMTKDEIWFFGHTGDFIGGKHISRKLYYLPMSDHYNNFSNQLLKRHSFDKINNKYFTAREINFSNKEEFISELDKWDLENRQSRFIINDSSIYRLFGNEVFLPLWDNRIVDYFEEVPMKYKVKEVLYNNTAIEYIKELNLDKYLDKSYYKKESIFDLIRRKVICKMKPNKSYVLSHGFNIYFSIPYVKDKVYDLLRKINEKGIKVEKANTDHFNYYLAIIDLYKIIEYLEKIKEKNN